QTRAGVVYALLLRFPGADATDVARRDPAHLRSSVEAAVAARIVPKSYADAVPKVVESLGRRRVADFLDGSHSGAPPTAAAVALRAIRAAPAERVAIAELALDHGANDAGFWAAVARDARIPR